LTVGQLATVIDEPHVLVVDDNPDKRFAILAALTPLGLPIVEADSGFAALRCLIEQDFAVILLDVRMPTMDGFETAGLIRQRQQSEMTPIIFLTAFDSDDIKSSDHYAGGAVDFLVAPIDPTILRAKVSVFANLFARGATLAARAQEIETSANQLRLLTDVAPIGIFQTDAADLYTYTNPRWSEITGIAQQDAVGRPWGSLIALQDAAGRPWGPLRGPTPQSLIATAREELQKPGKEFSFQTVVPGRPGHELQIVVVTATAIPDAVGGSTGCVGTVADMTLEVEAHIAASHLRAVVESSHDAIISKDLNGTITSWNAGAERLYGYSSAEVVGQSIVMLVPTGHDDEVPEILGTVRLGELVEDFETIRMRKDGTLVDVSLTTSPILGAAGVVVGASIIARDISDRRKAEQLKDEFLAMVSHELRTPLSSIVAHIELLLDDDLLEAKNRRRFLEVIDRNSVRLERLVGDLLFVAQIESAHLSLSMSDVDIVVVATESIEAMSLWAQQSEIEVTLISEPTSLLLTGDPGRLGQAIDNLISNAIKYSPRGGAVAVRILTVDETCVIEIEDHGIGIATEELGLLFDRFFRGSTATTLHIQGVGLGLLIVKRIIEGHGGEVTVMSETGVGTTFRVVLPLVQSEVVMLSSSPSSQELS
jgi:PAS domain S-box-containing protein